MDRREHFRLASPVDARELEDQLVALRLASPEVDGSLTDQPDAFTDYIYNAETDEIESATEYPIMAPVSYDMDDLQFLNDAPRGTASMRIINPDATEFTISNLCHEVILNKSLVLGNSFENIDGGKQLTIYFSQTAIIALLRWMYLDDYTLCEAMLYRPSPLLLHAQVLHLSVEYRLPDLTEQAWQHITKILSTLDKSGSVTALDMAESVRFVYTEMRASLEFRQLLAKYCITFFPSLNEEIFRQTAFESPAFHRDLQHANLLNDFQSEHAGDITQLPVCENGIHVEDLPTWKGGNDFTCQFHTINPTRPRTYRSGFPASAFRPTASTFTPASQVSPRIFNQFADFSLSASPPQPRKLSNRSGPLQARHLSYVNSKLQSSLNQSRNLVLRTQSPWLPAEEQAANESQLKRFPFGSTTAYMTTGNELMHDGTAKSTPFSHENPSTVLEEKQFVPSSGQVAEASTSSSHQTHTRARAVIDHELGFEYLTEHDFSPASRIESIPDSASDSEWTTVDTPSQSQASESDEYIFPSDSEWSDVDYPARA